MDTDHGTSRATVFASPSMQQDFQVGSCCRTVLFQQGMVRCTGRPPQDGQSEQSAP